MDNGAEFIRNFRAAEINAAPNGFTVKSDSGKKVETRRVINCAGIYADTVAGLIGDRSFKIGARKGEYILLDRESGAHVSRTLFSCPDEKGKGVLVTPTADGNLLIGPTSHEQDDKSDNSTSAEGLAYVIQRARGLVDKLPLYNTITSFCGVRAYSDRHDFIIEPSKIDKRFINVAGIESPGLTASPAIAAHVAETVIGEIGNVKTNPNFNGTRKSDSFFKELSLGQKNALIKRDPAYGKIICRCEEVTLGELLFTLNRNPEPVAIDGLKRRVRAGMGRCQGGFCQPYVAELLKDKLKTDYSGVTKSGGGSYIFTGTIK
jgi:glycerol-3-phosphate dehydrogenase